MTKNKGFLPQMDECKNYSAYGAEWLENFFYRLCGYNIGKMFSLA